MVSLSRKFKSLMDYVKDRSEAIGLYLNPKMDFITSENQPQEPRSFYTVGVAHN